MIVKRLLCSFKIVLAGVTLLHYADATGECPIDDGYVRRGSYCCKPVKCKINEDYILCTDALKPGQDQCVQCPVGTVNQDEINTANVSYHIDVCQKPDCVCGPEEALLMNPAECAVTGRKKCECDRDRGFCGHDYMICQLSPQLEPPLEEGFELTQDCTIEPCKDGFFKDRKGLGKCGKHRECPKGFITTFNGSNIKDRECKRDLNAVSSTTVQPNTSDPRTKSESDSSFWSLKAVFVVIMILGITLILSVSICCIYKSICRDRSSEDDQGFFSITAQKLLQKVTNRPGRTAIGDVEKNSAGNGDHSIHTNERGKENGKDGEDQEQLPLLDLNSRVPADTTPLSGEPRISGHDDESQPKLHTTENKAVANSAVPTGDTLKNACENNHQASVKIGKQNSSDVFTVSTASPSLPDEVGQKMDFSSMFSTKSLHTTPMVMKDTSELHNGKPCARVHPQQKESGVFTSESDLDMPEGDLEFNSLLESSSQSSENEDDQQTLSKETFPSV